MTGLILPYGDKTPRIAAHALGEGTNIQDGTIVHGNTEVEAHPARGYRTTIGSGVTVGHMALLHACTLEDGSFVGIKACLLDGATVEGEGGGGGEGRRRRAARAGQARPARRAVGGQPGPPAARIDPGRARRFPLDGGTLSRARRPLPCPR